MPENDIQLMHETIHIHYRQKVSDLEWDLAQALAREKVKDRMIADLTKIEESAPEA